MRGLLWPYCLSHPRWIGAHSDLSNNRPHQRIGRGLPAGKLVQFAQRLPLIDAARMFGVQDKLFQLGGAAVGFGQLRLAQPAIEFGQHLLRLRGELGRDKLLQLLQRLVVAIMLATIVMAFGIMGMAAIGGLSSVNLCHRI